MTERTTLAPHPVGRSLPRGRHKLSRADVEADQRLRILLAFAPAMADNGYVNTPVAAIIRCAGVSRETYYRIFTDKLDGFLAALDLVSEVLLAELTTALSGPGDLLDRVDGAFARYLGLLTDHRAEARLFLVEASAAGAEAIARRARVHDRIADELAVTLGTSTAEGRFACLTIVTSVSSMIAAPLITDDRAAIDELALAVSGFLRRAHSSGLLA